ncbi:hypothetical protein [Bacillus pacificus]|uniref:hypothetical protein n=1 Tax=Bacillus pacificus TaxID=2026187 RepID=UPI003980472F
MKHILFIASCILTFIIGGSLSVHAFSPKELPVSQSSDHWKVIVGKADANDSNALKSKEGIFNVYSVDVKNIGNKVYNATVEIFRDEPNTQTRYWLTSGEIPKTQDFYHHANQPISSEAKMIEVIVTWREKPYEMTKDGQKYPARKFKQTFVFKQE